MLDTHKLIKGLICLATLCCFMVWPCFADDTIEDRLLGDIDDGQLVFGPLLANRPRKVVQARLLEVGGYGLAAVNYSDQGESTAFLRANRPGQQPYQDEHNQAAQDDGQGFAAGTQGIKTSMAQPYDGHQQDATYQPPGLAEIEAV